MSENKKRKFRLILMGQRFTIVTDETDAYMDELVNRVQARIYDIRKSYQFLSGEGCSLLAALDYCDEKQKLKEQIEQLRGQIRDYLNDSGSLQEKNEKLQGKNAALQEENDRLTQQLARLNTEFERIKAASPKIAAKPAVPVQKSALAAAEKTATSASLFNMLDE
ncbi:MAG: cell division protein ZapA [Oscillospiraceae bacterium]|jgi:cell division protein ZapA (FtsZ GTPase activity inhibitor)|nr:cell division protein ZapA [Oscillospiraceae bacterium]